MAAVALAVGTLMLSVADALWPLRLMRWALRPSAGGFVSLLARHLCYSFIHANPVHALLNGWVLLQIAFRTPLRLCHLGWAYLIAASCPAAWAVWPQGGSVVGMSGVVFALLGQWMPHVARPVRYNMVIALWLFIGGCLGSQAVTLHLYCYLLGIIIMWAGKSPPT